MTQQKATQQKAQDVSPIPEIIDPDDEGGRPSVSDGQIDIPDELPILGIDNFVLFPFMIAPMIVGEGHIKQLVDDALQRDRLIGVFLKKDAEKPEHFQNLYDTGTLAIILKMLRMPDGSVRLLLHGTNRIRIEEHLAEEPYPKARVQRLLDINTESWPVQAMTRSVQNMIGKIVKLGHLPEDLGASVNEISDPGKLADLAISHLSVKIEERQEILELIDVETRLEHVLEILGRETQVLELGSEIQSKVMTKVDKRQREFMLREQLKAVKKELGEDDETNPDIAEIQEAIQKARMPKQARETAEHELKRLEMIHPSSPEYSVSRNYLDWLTSLPWSKSTRDSVDIAHSQKILNEDHYDLTEIKERILEYLAVIKLKKQIRGPILCFVGPPGVGKTSLGRSIARALGRKFARISLGGMRDEAEIRGHRRTYIGAMPGRIVKTIRDAKSKNPLIMLDEIDKLGQDFRGDPASALLEVLDPEQNSSFTDNYLDMPFDLSNVMFITTANTLDPIPPALRDRMEVLKLSGYTAREKMEIAKRYLVPRAYENTGVTQEQTPFTDDGLLAIIEQYTREAGVRNLEREIQNVCRKVARRVAEGDKSTVTIEPERVRDMLGPRRVYSEVARRMGQPGLAIGLAWTPTGGEILFVEATAIPGGGQLLLTGQLGDVMKESGMAAVNFLHSHARALRIDEAAFSKQNFHVHVPAGATPKDGPSAGITLATALCSLLLQDPVKDYLAMTGEITLKGNVLPVGGIKEKVLGAYRAGIKEIILPARAREELEKDIPEEVLKGMQYHFVEHIVDVFRIAFPPQAERVESIPQPAAETPSPEKRDEGQESRRRGRRGRRGRQREDRRERTAEREDQQDDKSEETPKETPQETNTETIQDRPERSQSREPEAENEEKSQDETDADPEDAQHNRRRGRRWKRKSADGEEPVVTITRSEDLRESESEPTASVLKIEPDKDTNEKRAPSRRSSRSPRQDKTDAAEETSQDDGDASAPEDKSEDKPEEEHKKPRRGRSRRSSSRTRKTEDNPPEEKKESADAKDEQDKEEKPEKKTSTRRRSSRSPSSRKTTRKASETPSASGEKPTDDDEKKTETTKKTTRRRRSTSNKKKTEDSE